jgi:hypothetical protein
VQHVQLAASNTSPLRFRAFILFLDPTDPGTILRGTRASWTSSILYGDMGRPRYEDLAVITVYKTIFLLEQKGQYHTTGSSIFPHLWCGSNRYLEPGLSLSPSPPAKPMNDKWKLGHVERGTIPNFTLKANFLPETGHDGSCHWLYMSHFAFQSMHLQLD